MRRKIKRRYRKPKEEKAFLLSALRAVLSLCICVLFFMSAVIFDNDEIKSALYLLIREDTGIRPGLDSFKEAPAAQIEKILGEARFTSDAFPPAGYGAAVTSPFGKRINPVSGKNEIHLGIDLKAPEGKSIRSAFPGKCEKTGQNKFDGNYVILSHGNFKTKYCHLSAITAEEGMNLREGEEVGKAGATGWAVGSHLHFEIIKDGKYIDPAGALFHEI